MNGMKIALIEPNLLGHHKIYLESFYSVLKEMGCSLVIYTTEDLGILEGKKICYRKSRHLPSNPILKKCVVVLNFLFTTLNLWELNTCLRKDKTIDLVFFCCIDDYMNEMMPVGLFNRLFPFRFSALLLSPRSRKVYFSFDRRNILRSKYCSSVGTLDEFCISELSKFQSKVIHFPDFADESIANEEYYVADLILAKAEKRKIISLLGAINPRKGIFTFVETAKTLDAENYFFVLAGKPFLTSKETLYLQENFVNRANCFYWGRCIPTEADFNRLVSISDVIYAAYVNFTQSSNMFAKASLFEKPLIVSKGFYMEEVVRRYGFGIAIDQDSVHECADAIRLSVNQDEINEGYKDYLRNNSYSNLRNAFETVLKLSEHV